MENNIDKERVANEAPVENSVACEKSACHDVSQPNGVECEPVQQQCVTPEPQQQPQNNFGQQANQQCNPAANQQWQQPFGQQWQQPCGQQMGQAPRPVCPNSYLALSIIATIFGGLLGIVSIVYAAKVESQWYRGECDKAVKSSKRALWWGVGVLIYGVLSYIISWVIAFCFLAVSSLIEWTVDNHYDDDYFDDRTEQIYDTYYYPTY